MKKTAAFALSLLLAAGLYGCGKPTRERHTDVFFDRFDTVISVVAYTETDEEFRQMKEFIESEYKRYNDLYDIYHTYPGINNIKTINDSAGKSAVKVDKEIIDLLLFSKEWYKESGGKMNVALGSVLRLWHDARTRREYDGRTPPPSYRRLSRAAEHCDIDDIIIDREAGTVYIADPLLQIDVGAVAKGYATEKICRRLAEEYDSFAISAGGNVRTHGQPKSGKTRWGIGIESPLVDEDYNMLGGNVDTAFFSEDSALVCSGGYQRFFVYEGVRYHHLIDPRTLYPADIYSGVAVICPDSGDADAMSTSIFMMDSRQAVEFVEKRPDCMCILSMPDGTVIKSRGGERWLASEGVTNMTP